LSLDASNLKNSLHRKTRKRQRISVDLNVQELFDSTKFEEIIAQAIDNKLAKTL
jgi:hypothetical protein